MSKLEQDIMALVSLRSRRYEDIQRDTAGWGGWEETDAALSNLLAQQLIIETLCPCNNNVYSIPVSKKMPVEKMDDVVFFAEKHGFYPPGDEKWSEYRKHHMKLLRERRYREATEVETSWYQYAFDLAVGWLNDD